MNSARWKFPCIAIGAALLFMGCANTKEALISSNIEGDVTNPKRLRIAILPFEVPQEVSQKKGDYLRRQIFINLKRGGYNLVEKFVVDGVLARQDWDVSYLPKVPPQSLGEALGADAVIFGNLTTWEESYLAIHSSITIGCKIKLVDTRSGEVLWKSNYQKTDFDGILKLPTGLSSVVLAPILFLAKKENQFRLADEVTREMTSFLVQPAKNQPPRLFQKPLLISTPKKALAEIREGSAPDTRAASLFDEGDRGSGWKPLAESSSRGTALAGNDNDPPSPIEKSYTIQVGSYTRRDGARNMRTRLQGTGVDAFIYKAELKGKIWYRVQIKNFDSRKEARRFASETMGVGGLPYFITPFLSHSVQPAG